MSVKDKLLRLIPSYRCRDVIIKELSTMNQDMTQRMVQMKKQIEDLNEKNDYLFFCLQHLEGETNLETRKRVFKNIPHAEGKLRTIQAVTNYILMRLKEICDKNSIEFFLMAGTLLGAIRHEGYIPWDDDIDIGMMRSDYERLTDVIKNDSQIEMSTYYGVLGNRQIKVKLKKSDLFFVDIYLFDYIDTNEQIINSRWEETQNISREIDRLILKSLPAKASIKDWSRPIILDDVEQSVIQYTREIYDKYDYLGKGDYFCPAIDMPSGFRKNHPILKVEDHFPFAAMTFEGKQYGVWKNYMEYFEHIYDPWDLPRSIKPHLLKEYGNTQAELDRLTREGIEI